MCNKWKSITKFIHRSKFKLQFKSFQTFNDRFDHSLQIRICNQLHFPKGTNCNKAINKLRFSPNTPPFFSRMQSVKQNAICLQQNAICQMCNKWKSITKFIHRSKLKLQFKSFQTFNDRFDHSLKIRICNQLHFPKGTNCNKAIHA